MQPGDGEQAILAKRKEMDSTSLPHTTETGRTALFGVIHTVFLHRHHDKGKICASHLLKLHILFDGHGGGSSVA